MAMLDINKICVVDEQEKNGDELYFVVNGTKMKPLPSLNTGECYNFPYDPIYFSGMATVSLLEDDTAMDVLWIATAAFAASR